MYHTGDSIYNTSYYASFIKKNIFYFFQNINEALLHYKYCKLVKQYYETIIL